MVPRPFVRTIVTLVILASSFGLPVGALASVPLTTYQVRGSGFIGKAYISGTYAYVPDVTLKRLVILDISNPASLSFVGASPVTQTPQTVFVSGQYAYLTLNNSIEIQNVSNPAAPFRVSSLAIPGAFNTSERAFVQGNYFYVPATGPKFTIINVANPSAPTIVSQRNYGSQGAYVQGAFAYICENIMGLRIVNVSNPSNPKLKSTFNTDGQAEGVFVVGPYAYVADGSGGLDIIDVSSPSSPVQVGTVALPTYVQDVYVAGQYAFVAGGVNFYVVNIGVPSSPVLVDTTAISNENFQSVFVSGGFAYVTGYGGDLHTFDVRAY